MDDVLARKMDELAGGNKSLDFSVRFVDYDGTVELIYRDKHEPYKLKPLNELYGPANGPSVNPLDDTYQPLLHSIEQEIVRFDAKCQELTDATVLLVLQRMGMNPERSSDDPLICSIQTALRLDLSLNNYSRQEVRQAIRKIEKSVNRHKDGSRGYLEFIREYVPVR